MKSQSQLSPSVEILQRLDLIVSLLLERSEPDPAPTMTDKIMKLGELGASPAQVAQILRKPVNYVTAAMAMRKKAKQHA